jgi:transposase
MVMVDGQGIPLGSILASESPAEVRLDEKTLEAVKVPRKGRGRPIKRPMQLIGDKGYDSDQLRERPKIFKIDLFVPHHCNRKKPKTQDGRKLRRYREHWKVERTFSWLGIFRRLTLRYERLAKIYSAFSNLPVLRLS